MSFYNGFAYVYDTLMKDVDYDSWARYILDSLEPAGTYSTKILELGCGTGTLALKLASAGMAVTATDISEDMLAVAGEKAQSSGRKLNLLVQDMRNLNLKEKYHACITFCDGINYITLTDDLRLICDQVSGVLLDDGYFIIEFSSEYKLSTVIGNKTIAENQEEAAFIWENSYDGEERLLDFDLALFVRCEVDESEDGELFERYIEHHVQKAWRIDELSQIFSKNFDIIDVIDSETYQEVTDKSERIIIKMKKRRTK